MLYMDYARYDETLMRVRSAGGSKMIEGDSGAAAGSAFAGAMPLAPLTRPSDLWTPLLGERATTVGPGKLLQSESSYGLLLRIKDKFCAVRGSTLCHLQILET